MWLVRSRSLRGVALAVGRVLLLRLDQRSARSADDISPTLLHPGNLLFRRHFRGPEFRYGWLIGHRTGVANSCRQSVHRTIIRVYRSRSAGNGAQLRHGLSPLFFEHAERSEGGEAISSLRVRLEAGPLAGRSIVYLKHRGETRSAERHED